MADAQTRFDNERLDSRLERVRESLSSSIEDQAQLQRLATLGTVSGLIAHEVRNLMTPIKSYAQLALSKPGDVELTQKALRRAFEGATQAAAIAESLMELAGTGMPADRKPRAMCHVEHAAVGLAESIGVADVTLALELEPGVQAEIEEADLRQVLLNLVQNAAGARVAGAAGVIQIRARRESGSGWSLAGELEDGGVDGSGLGCWHLEGEWGGDSARVLIEVIDDGVGIAAEALPRVFGAWVRGSAAGESDAVGDEGGLERAGRGLGLATCAALVGKAGGRLGVVSEPGVGTRFVIELPAD